MKILLDEGTYTCQQDKNGNNIAHSLIAKLYYFPELEDTIVNNFKSLLDMLTVNQIKDMLYQENKFNLRPLEFAAQHGSCKMFQVMMDTPGVYLYKTDMKGLTLYKHYDITDYEGDLADARRNKSPLLYFTFIDKRFVTNEGQIKFNTSSHMVHWSMTKFKSSIPALMLLFLLRFIYIIGYFVNDMDTSFFDDDKDYIPGNTTKHCRANYAIVLSVKTKYCLHAYLIVHSAAVILLDIYETAGIFSKAQWPIWNMLDDMKSLYNQVFFYKYSNMAFSIFVTITICLSYYDSPVIHDILDVLRVICPTLVIWHTFYFIQLIPSIGYFVITIQLILVDLLHFMIIFPLMFIPFMHSFQSVINTNTNVGCIDGFNDMFGVFYSLFTIMLNMVDLRSFDIRNSWVGFI